MSLTTVIVSNLKKFSTNRTLVNGLFNIFNRQFHSSPMNCIKEFTETKEGNVTIIEGITKPSERLPYLFHPNINAKKGDCPMCALQLEVKHTDVLILSQFVRSDGCMLPKTVTGLCNRQQRRVRLMVAMAQKAGLMPNLTPSYSKKDPTLRYRWKKYNTYFLEETIDMKKKVAKKWLKHIIQKPLL